MNKTEARQVHHALHVAASLAHQQWVRCGQEGQTTYAKERYFYNELASDIGDLADRIYVEFKLGEV